MSDVNIDSLSIKIESEAGKSTSGIDNLRRSLESLKSVSKGGVGLTAVRNQISNLGRAINETDISTKKVKNIVNVLNSLGSVQKAGGLSSTVNALKKLPEISKQLSGMDLGKFGEQIQRVVTVIKPLATEMDKVAKGFSAFPARIQRLISENGRLTASNNKLNKSYGLLNSGITGVIAKFSAVAFAMSRVARVLSGWITESNKYVENLNLFTVAMGEYASEAQAYAEYVADVMGIDPSEWMRNQGIFMTLASGFGVASDRAAQMSKTLTQLGYDLSSFFNISYEDSMQKLQSGISGELEPLRRLGYDLSQARLEAIALSLGIDQSVSSMTQAEKAQLRYVAIMTQVTTAQGDMARTLQAPANQLRILKAQVVQASRALGDIFIPMLNAILPYVIAGAQAVRLLAQSIASLLGFELPSIDYSGVASIGSSAEEAADGLDEATGSAQKLKRSLLGFDELNVLPSASSAGGGAGLAAGGAGFDFDIGQYDYDFIGDAVNDRVSDILDGIKEIGKTIGDVVGYFGPALKGLLGMITVSKLTKWITKLKTIKPVVSGVSKVFSAFWLGMKDGEGILGRIRSGFQYANMELGFIGQTVGKTAGVLGGFAATAISAFSSVKGLATGTMELDQALVNIGISAGGTALILSGMFSAGVGIATASFGLLAGAIGGVIAAYYQNNTLTGEAKEKLDAYVESVTSSAGAIGAYITQSQNAVTELVPVRDSIANTTLSISTMISEWMLAGSVTEEQVSNMLDSISTLESDAAAYLGGLYNSVNTYIAGAFVNASDESKKSITEITKNIALIQAEGDEAVANASISLQEILKEASAAGGELTDEMASEMMEMLNILGVGTHDFGVNASEIQGIIDNVDLSKGVFSITDAISQISGVIDEQKKKNQEFIDSFDFAAIEATVGTEAATQLRGYLESIANEYNTQFDSILTNGASAIIDNYANNIGKIEGVTGQGFELAMLSLQSQIGATGVRLPKALFDGYIEGFYEKLGTVDETSKEFAGSLDDSMRDALDINSPAKIAYPWGESIVEGIGVGMERGSTLIQNTSSKIIDMFVSAFSGIATKFVEIGKKIPESIGNGLAIGNAGLIAKASAMAVSLYNVYANSGTTKYIAYGKSIPTAIGMGINEGKSNALSASKTMVMEIQAALSGSVGTSFKSIGKRIADDVASGFSQSNISSSAGKMLNGVLSKFETFYSRVRSSINTLVSAIGTAFSSLRINMEGVRFTRIPTLTIPRFETGGFPDVGQLFLSRESGPELVGTIGGNTAVANNQQIIQGIEQGVYRAVTSAMGGGGDIVVHGEVDGDKLLTVVVKKAQQQQRRTGFNPLTTMIG